MNYSTYRIADLIEEIAMGPFGSNIKVECFVDSGVPVLNGSNLDGFALSEREFRYVTPEKADSLKKANASRGDVIITHRGTLGQIVYIPETSNFERYVISQSQFRVRCNEKILPEYMVYYFHTNIGQHKLLSNASQVGVPALARPSTTFQQIEIEIPDIDTQKRVVAIISNLQKKIDCNNKINDNLHQQAHELYYDWFIACSPFNGIIPETWYIGTLSDLALDIICGKTPSTKRTEYYGNDVPFITIPDMHNQIYAVTTERNLSTLGAASQSGKMLPRNSICVSCIGTMGLVCLVTKPSQTNQQINSIIPKKDVSPYYVYLMAQTLSGTIQNRGSGGSTIYNLNKAQFARIEALIPSVDAMHDFDSIVRPMFEAIDSNQQESMQLAMLRDTLLPKLMSGEIDVFNV